MLVSEPIGYGLVMRKTTANKNRYLIVKIVGLRTIHFVRLEYKYSTTVSLPRCLSKPLSKIMIYLANKRIGLVFTDWTTQVMTTPLSITTPARMLCQSFNCTLIMPSLAPESTVVI